MPYACGREPQGVVRTGLAVLVVSIVSVTTVAGQSATASLTGTVQDEQGLSIGAATVSVESAARALKRETVTNDEGYFAVAALQPGAYTLTIVKSGFIRYELTDIVLNVLDQRAFSIRLRVGAIQQTIEVKGGSPAIQTSPAVQTTIDRQFIENLPLNGRSFHALFELTPGVVLAKTFFTNSGQFSVNGQRSNSNYFTVDGVSANFGVTAGSDVRLGQAGGGSLPAVSVTGGFNNLASVDATEEFTIQTSTFAPEFGRTPGAQVSIVTRSGTNELRGVVFEYLRSDRFDANDWFANAQGLAKPALRQNDFGGVLGGPIVRNRSFFFFSYEGLRLRLPQTKVEVVPSMATSRGAGHSAAARRLSPAKRRAADRSHRRVRGQFLEPLGARCDERSHRPGGHLGVDCLRSLQSLAIEGRPARLGRLLQYQHGRQYHSRHRYADRFRHAAAAGWHAQRIAGELESLTRGDDYDG
jgi:hypothetical protein